LASRRVPSLIPPFASQDSVNQDPARRGVVNAT
jgi:hypothetical protein